MDAKVVGRALPLAVLGWLAAPGAAWAGQELALLTADDNLGLIGLLAALMVFWLYFRTTTEDQI
jgi:hypothetical protein